MFYDSNSKRRLPTSVSYGRVLSVLLWFWSSPIDRILLVLFVFWFKEKILLQYLIAVPIGACTSVYDLSISISHAFVLTIWFTCCGAGCIRSVRDTCGLLFRNPEKPLFCVWNGFLWAIVLTTASLRHCFHAWFCIPHLVHCPALPRCWRISGFISLWAAAQSVCPVSPKLFSLAAWIVFSAYSFFSCEV